MLDKDSLALAAGWAFALIAATVSPVQAQAVDTPKLSVSGVVVMPQPQSAASAAKTAVPPPTQAATTAAAAPAQAQIKVPAPPMTLPTTPPTIATAAKTAEPAASNSSQTATAKSQAPAQAAEVASQPNPKPATGTMAAAGSKPAAMPNGKTSSQKTAGLPAKPGKEEKSAAKKTKAGNAKDDQKQAKTKPGEKVQAPVVQAKLDPGGVVLRQTPKFFFGLFDAPKPEDVVLSEEQVQHDQKLAAVPDKKKFKVKEEFVPVTVPFKGYKPGTIVIDTKEKYLYFVESPISAIRYAVAVGREGLLFTGKASVGAKQPWPKWIPTKEMVARDPGKYGKYTDGMEGGPDNPLGARALYLGSTLYRIHGSNEPETIGQAVSSGCIRMLNEDVIDLYERTRVGTRVIVQR